VPKMIHNRAEWYQWALGKGGYAASSDDETTEVVIDKNGKETAVVVKKPKGPMKGVELQGKVGGRRRAVKPRTPSTKSTTTADK
jgi:DnaJ family protein C protein 1